MRRLVLICALLMPQYVSAGGIAEKFSIVDFSSDGPAFSFTLKAPENGGISFAPKCSSMRVSGTYGWFYWVFKRNELVQKELHLRALEYLEERFLQEKPVYFGVIGEGLNTAHQSDVMCYAESRALVLIEDENIQVYSFYRWP